MKKIFCIILYLFILSNFVYAQWPNIVEENLEITTWGNFPFSAIEDGKGGAFISFGKMGYRQDNTEINSLWFMRINKYGDTILEPVQIGPTGMFLRATEMKKANDGNILIGIYENEFLYWEGGDRIYYTKLRMQKLDTLGNHLWGDGVYALIDTLQNEFCDLIPDSSGGCYISTVAVNKYTTPFYTGYKAIQRINKDGERMWGDSGAVLYSGELNENGWAVQYKIFHIGSENLAVVSEYNHTRGIYENVQGVNGNGEILWTLPPREGYKYIDAIADKLGGMYIIYNRYGNDFSSYEFTVDRINNTGNYVFNEPNVFIDSCGRRSKIRSLYVTNNNVMNIIWLESEESSYWDTYFQRVSTNGNTLFPTFGQKILPSNYFPKLMISNPNDFIVLANTSSSALTQKFTRTGEKLWGNDGVIIAKDLDQCFTFPQLITDNNEGCIVLWQKCKQGIRGKQISKNGGLGIITNVKIKSTRLPADYYVSENYPNPFNPTTTIEYSIRNRSNLLVTMSNSLGENIIESNFDNIKPGNYQFKIDGSKLSSGIYFVNFSFKDSESKKQIIYQQTNKILLLK